MARPNITVLVEDQSFVVPFSESGSLTRAGMVSLYGLPLNLGTTAENKTGIMEISSVGEWVARLNSTETINGFGAGDIGDGAITSEMPFFHTAGGEATGGTMFAGGTFARWPNGPTGAWKNEWWAAHNYLQYGGVLVVGGTGSIENTSLTTSSTPFHDKQVPLDLVFAATGDQVGHTSNIASFRQDCIAICPTTQVDTTAAKHASQTEDEFNVSVHGYKKHLGINQGLREDTLDDLVKTALAADVAGCMARTDQVADPWWSPAGFKRGQILGSVRLQTNPTDAQMDTMYNIKLNPVVTFPGEGTVLFGDKTLASSSSTLSRINVSRLFIYLKKTIGAAARDTLFELNDAETRSSFVNAVNPFLRGVMSRRGIYDYRVVCDETNNTGSIIDSNNFVADIFVKPTKSINFIRIRFTNKNTTDSLE